MHRPLGFVLLLTVLLLSSCKTTSVGYRLLHYGDSDINDFKQFPAHALAASSHPQAYSADTTAFKLNKQTLSAQLQKHNTLAFLPLVGVRANQ